jgi:hexulose-6-phosphate isomerase
MSFNPGRRSFFGHSVAAAAAAMTAANWSSSALAAEPKRLKKAVKKSMVQFKAANGEPLPLVEQFKILKEIGYDGIDMDQPADHAEVLRARDESGLTVHGVVDYVHWAKPLSHPDPKVRSEGVEGLKTALRDCKIYGGTTVLLVVGIVNKEISYADAYQRSQDEIRKCIPLARELGLKIAFENVWNMMLLSPLEFARYIDEFESDLIGAYFDVGNIVNYGWPEHWIRTLGKRIMKLDIKEYSRGIRDQKGPGAGFGVELGEGDCDWPAVMKALDEIGYTDGWATAEVRGGDRDRLTEVYQRMDRILQFE